MKRSQRVSVQLPALVFTLCLVTLGCTQLGLNRPGKHETAGTLIGGALGAGTGAIVGAQVGNPGAGVAIGSGVGAVAGNAVGRGLDEVRDEAHDLYRRHLEDHERATTR